MEASKNQRRNSISNASLQQKQLELPEEKHLRPVENEEIGTFQHLPPITNSLSKSISFPEKLTIASDTQQLKSFLNDNPSVYQKDFTTKNWKNYYSQNRLGKQIDPSTKVSQENIKQDEDTANAAENDRNVGNVNQLDDFTHQNWEPRFRIEPRYQLVNKRHRFPRSSLYKSDFVPFSGASPAARIKPDLWNPSRSLAPIDFKTTNLVDYKEWNVSPPEKNKDPKRHILSDIPFVAGTAYRNEFVNWGPNARTYDPPKQPETFIPNLPLRGKSTYNDSYSKQMRGQRAESMAPRRGSVNNSLPFIGQSSYKKSFVPLKIETTGNTPIAKEISNAGLITGGVSYKGSYKTVFSEQYVAPMHRMYVGPRNSVIESNDP